MAETGDEVRGKSIWHKQWKSYKTTPIKIKPTRKMKNWKQNESLNLEICVVTILTVFAKQEKKITDSCQEIPVCYLFYWKTISVSVLNEYGFLWTCIWQGKGKRISQGGLGILWPLCKKCLGSKLTRPHVSVGNWFNFKTEMCADTCWNFTQALVHF